MIRPAFQLDPRVGDLVTMDLSTSDDLDYWGVGIVVETTEQTPEDVCVFWSRLGADSWEMISMLKVINENR